MTFTFPDLEGVPALFDTFVGEDGGRRLTDPAQFQNPSRALGTALAGPLVFNGACAAAANGGAAPPLATGSPSHLDGDAFPAGSGEYLMTPSSGQPATPVLGPVLVGALADLGWTVRPTGDVTSAPARRCPGS